MSKNIAITANGSLQYVAMNVSTPLEAVRDFDAKVRINPHGLEIEELAEDFNFYVLDDNQVALVDEDTKAFYELDLRSLRTSL